jgi:hypothetical protein
MKAFRSNTPSEPVARSRARSDFTGCKVSNQRSEKRDLYILDFNICESIGLDIYLVINAFHGFTATHRADQPRFKENDSRYLFFSEHDIIMRQILGQDRPKTIVKGRRKNGCNDNLMDDSKVLKFRLMREMVFELQLVNGVTKDMS